jgi:hypothetical protein
MQCLIIKNDCVNLLRINNIVHFLNINEHTLIVCSFSV